MESEREDWVESHKELLRDAISRQTSSDRPPEDEEDFRAFVSGLLVLGQLTPTMIDAVLVPKAKSIGLTEECAQAIIEDLASQ